MHKMQSISYNQLHFNNNRYMTGNITLKGECQNVTKEEKLENINCNDLVDILPFCCDELI